jgi:hypothetical protein
MSTKFGCSGPVLTPFHRAIKDLRIELEAFWNANLRRLKVGAAAAKRKRRRHCPPPAYDRVAIGRRKRR